jgi:hypothetical protein
MEPLAQPRFPAVAHKKGHYESWYLKAGEPGGSRAVWIRYTIHKRPGAEPEASLWLTLFDSAHGRPLAVKETAGAARLSANPESFLEVEGLGRFAPGLAEGQIEGAGRHASWHLEIGGGEPPLEHLPAKLYRGPLPRTKLLTVSPAAQFSGWVEVEGRRLEIETWPGMIGHNWGTQHAERWVWMHGTDFDGHGPDSWIDLAIGRVKLGPWTSPWVANGAVSLDGVRHRLGGIGTLRATEVEAQAGELHFSLPGAGLTLRGAASSPPDDTVAWIYSDPDGSQHHTLNCSISRLNLDMVSDDGALHKLTTRTGCTYEYGSRDFDHDLPIEPFADG